MSLKSTGEALINLPSIEQVLSSSSSLSMRGRSSVSCMPSSRVRPEANGPLRKREPVLKEPQPFLHFGVGHCSFLKPVPDEAILALIQGRQSGVCVVPDLRRHLVPAKILLEMLFILCTIQHKPIRSRIADPVAEDDIQSKSDLVDKVIHVAF